MDYSHRMYCTGLAGSREEVMRQMANRHSLHPAECLVNSYINAETLIAAELTSYGLSDLSRRMMFGV